jgi:GT2 family glycosyltransferase
MVNICNSFITILIVNWNGEKFIQDCLVSLHSQTYKDFEIIFVDNCSTDDSLLLAERLASDLRLNIKFISVEKNIGFAAGNNEGMKYSSGRYIALLNTDAVAEKDWLENLVKAMDSDPDIGICASKLIVLDEDVIDSAGDGYSTFGHAFKRGEGMPPHAFSESGYVFGACAGAALYRREMIDEIGLFDKDFFLIFEDTDLNFRAQLSGWKCLYVPLAKVHHKVGGTVKKVSNIASYYAVRNDKLVKIKNIPLSVLLYKLPCLVLGEMIWLIYYIINGRFRYYLKANIDVFRNVPAFLKKRREIMNLKRVSNRYIISLMTTGFRLYGFKRVKRYLFL